MIALVLMEITLMNKANFLTKKKKRVFFVGPRTFQPMVIYVYNIAKLLQLSLFVGI